MVFLRDVLKKLGVRLIIVSMLLCSGNKTHRMGTALTRMPHRGSKTRPKNRGRRLLPLVAVLSFFLPLLVMALATVSLARGTKGEPNPNGASELRFYHSIGSYNKDVLNGLIESYNRVNRESRVLGVFQGNEEEVFRRLLSQEALPDIVQVPTHFLPLLIEKGTLVEMGPYVQNKLKGDIAEKFWKSVSVGGKVYGLPFSYDVKILLVNQHILRTAGVRQDEEPGSWDEIFSAAERIKQNTRGKWGMYVPMESAAQFVAFVQSYSGKPVFRGREIRIDAPETAAAMEALQSAVFVKGFMPPRITAEEAEGLFLSGNLGLMVASSAALVYTETNLPYDLGVWHLPAKKAAPPVATGSCLSLTKTNPKREREAFRFIEFLTRDENAINWHAHTGSPAIRTSVRDSLDLLIFYEESPNHMASTIELDKAVIFNLPFDSLRPFDYVGFNRIVKKALDEIMINGRAPAEVLGAAQGEIEQLQKPR